MQALFERVRAGCDSAVWSRGVSLARGGAVVGESADAGHTVLRVSTHGGLVAPVVNLYPEDEEWDCDCSGPSDPCEHVAAAVIALRRAQREGHELPGSSQDAGRVGYRFTRSSGSLVFDRAIVTGDREEPLRGSLVALAAGALDGPAFVASNEDLRVEQKLGSRLRGVMPAEFMPELLRALAGCEDVRLDDRRVSASSEPVLPRVVLEDRGEGFALELRPDPELVETFANGAALCGAVLRPLGHPQLTLREREQLAGGRLFGPDEVSLLLSRILPDLEARLPVEIRTQRLPRRKLGLECGGRIS